LHTSSNAHLVEYLLLDRPTVLSSMHSLHLLNPHLAELFRILSDSSSPFWTHSQVLPNALWCICSMPTCQSSSQNSKQSFCLILCISYTALPPRYSTTLRSFPWVVDSSSCAAARICLTPQSWEMHPLCTTIRTCSVLSHPPSMKPQRPSPEIRHTPANANL